MDHSASVLSVPALNGVQAAAAITELIPEWQVEEVALQLGWLRECPYHGEPFQALEPPSAARIGGTPYADARLLAAAAALASAYGGRCRFCERDDTAGG